MTDPNEISQRGAGMTADQLFESVRREACIQAIEKTTETHIAELVAVREKYPLDDLDLLSSNISNIKSVPKEVRQRIANFQNRIRLIIEKVATQIEDRKYKPTEDEILDMRLSVVEKTRVHALVSAEKKLQISYESLKTTVEVLTEMNKVLVDQLHESEQMGDEVTTRRLLLGNAILVYELTDFVIRYVEDFQLNGIDEIMQIQRSEFAKMDQVRLERQELKKRAEAIHDSSLRQSTLAGIAALEESMNVIRIEWERYVADINRMKETIGPVQTRIYDLKVLRDLAKMQIRVIEISMAVGMLKRNILALEDAMKGLEKLKLESLTPDRVRKLIYLGGGSGPAPSLNAPANHYSAR